MARVVLQRTNARRESGQAALRFTRKVLREMQFQARLNLFGGPYTQGNLARSIKIDGPFLDGHGARGSVGSDLPYADAVERGAGLWGPSMSKFLIVPYRTRLLHFYWRRLGRQVKLPYVNHPGQRPKKYLERAAKEIGRRHNMIILTYEV